MTARCVCGHPAMQHGGEQNRGQCQWRPTGHYRQACDCQRFKNATSCSLPNDSTVGASEPATDAAADVPHETPDLQP